MNGALCGLEDYWLLVNSVVAGSRKRDRKGECVSLILLASSTFHSGGTRRCGSVSTELNPWVIVGSFFQDLVVLSLEDK